MRTINKSDVLLATVSQPGKLPMTIRLVGVTSIQSVYETVRQMISCARGVISLSVRNLTQGWSMSENIFKSGGISIRNAISNSKPKSFVTETPRQLQFAF